MKQDDGAFEDRKKSQEAKYKLDEERRFKIRARRNKLLGLWAAERLGMDEGAGLDFAKDVVMAGLDGPNDAALVSCLRQRMNDLGADLPEAELAARLPELEETARRQVLGEFPTALDTDHGAVGDTPYSKK
jgi:hypothetical protein